jgi:hypothetical protein
MFLCRVLERRTCYESGGLARGLLDRMDVKAAISGFDIGNKNDG